MHISIMRGVYEPLDPTDRFTATWDDIADVLTDFNKASVKERVPMFNLWEFKDLPEAEIGHKKIFDKAGEWTGDYRDIPGTIRRCANNAVALHGLVLDYDKGLSLEEAVERHQHDECVIYTTWHHHSKGDRYRVVIPFTRPMLIAEFERKSADIKRRYPFADNASFSMSQAIYMHSGEMPAEAFSARWAGAWIDPDQFKETEPEAATEAATAPVQRDYDDQDRRDYEAAVMLALRSCSGVRRGAMSGNAGVLGLATLVRHAGGDRQDFEGVCNEVLALDSCARSSKAVRDEAWRSSTTTHATRRFRDTWLAEHGGRSFTECFKEVHAEKISSQLNVFDKKYGISREQKIKMLNDLRNKYSQTKG